MPGAPILLHLSKRLSASRPSTGWARDNERKEFSEEPSQHTHETQATKMQMTAIDNIGGGCWEFHEDIKD